MSLFGDFKTIGLMNVTQPWIVPFLKEAYTLVPIKENQSLGHCDVILTDTISTRRQLQRIIHLLEPRQSIVCLLYHTQGSRLAWGKTLWNVSWLKRQFNQSKLMNVRQFWMIGAPMHPEHLVENKKWALREFYKTHYAWAYNDQRSLGARCIRHLIYQLNWEGLLEHQVCLWGQKRA